MNAHETNSGTLRVNVVRLAVAVGLVLLIPLIAMQFTSEVNWDAFDFIVAGALLFGAGLAFLFAMGRVRNTTHRLMAVAAIFVVLAWLWAELAVGLFTDWGS